MSFFFDYANLPKILMRLILLNRVIPLMLPMLIDLLHRLEAAALVHVVGALLFYRL